ncbi:DUF3040 domain-containing protein [Actinotalea solisilvae]|uniref:DUF3040 domain-containing protein n=1 Tax=Actinotalea solisilvae TaxID=2072922 RepID=UPI0018F1C71B|nr:DUF3040 domain-containing protein [Actinotalea solisilvae]
MPLSEYEQRVLEQMERQLTSDDPKLVNTFQGGGTRTVKRWLLTGAGAVAGLTVLVIGAATSQPLVGVLGFVAMFASVVLAFSPPRRKGPAGIVMENGATRPRPKGRSTSPGFIARFEQRWDRRRDERGR